jgi:hypothetical protein
MKKLSLLWFLLIIISKSYGQNLEPTKLSYKDSIELTNTWKKFKSALEKRNTKTLHQMALKIVHCDMFQNPNPNTSYNQDIYNSYISFNKFLAQFYHELPKLKLWIVMKTKKYHIDVSNAIDFHPPNIKYQKKHSLKIYDIWYLTFEPNEIAKGHEGESEAFEFVKINGRFKFYGLTSIP